MSDKLTAIAFICATALAMSGMFFFATYKKEKLEIKNKTNIKDLIDTEIAVTAEDKKSKK